MTVESQDVDKDIVAAIVGASWLVDASMMYNERPKNQIRGTQLLMLTAIAGPIDGSNTMTIIDLDDNDDHLFYAAKASFLYYNSSLFHL